MGSVTCVSVNPDGLSIASGGGDGVVKIWSRNGILRTNFASVGGAVTSRHWDNAGKHMMFTYDRTFKQDQAQFRVHRRLVTCSPWNRVSGELITGGEDRPARVFDADGWMHAESAACNFAVSSVAFFSWAKLCLIGTVNLLSLTDNRLRLLNTIPFAKSAAVGPSLEQSRVIVARQRYLRRFAGKVYRVRSEERH
jgi:intraflagellar transport protein 80